jgi:hypothetical protein
MPCGSKRTGISGDNLRRSSIDEKSVYCTSPIKIEGVAVFLSLTIYDMRPRDGLAQWITQDNDRIAGEGCKFGKDPGFDHETAFTQLRKA